jgi:hypothetical protein
MLLMLYVKRQIAGRKASAESAKEQKPRVKARSNGTLRQRGPETSLPKELDFFGGRKLRV